MQEFAKTKKAGIISYFTGLLFSGNCSFYGYSGLNSGCNTGTVYLGSGIFNDKQVITGISPCGVHIRSGDYLNNYFVSGQASGLGCLAVYS